MYVPVGGGVRCIAVLLYWSAELTLYRSIAVCAGLNSVCTGDGRVGIGCGERGPSLDGFYLLRISLSLSHSVVTSPGIFCFSRSLRSSTSMARTANAGPANCLPSKVKGD